MSYATVTDWFRITEVESVYYAVRAEYLYETDCLVFTKLNRLIFIRLPVTENSSI